MSLSTFRRIRASLTGAGTTALVGRRPRRHRRHDDRGQSTAEYGLVILAAGGIALGVIAWASSTGSFTDLFESVIENLSESL